MKNTPVGAVHLASFQITQVFLSRFNGWLLSHRAAGPREAPRHAHHAHAHERVAQGGNAGEHGRGARSSPPRDRASRRSRYCGRGHLRVRQGCEMEMSRLGTWTKTRPGFDNRTGTCLCRLFEAHIPQTAVSRTDQSLVGCSHARSMIVGADDSIKLRRHGSHYRGRQWRRGTSATKAAIRAGVRSSGLFRT